MRLCVSQRPWLQLLAKNHRTGSIELAILGSRNDFAWDRMHPAVNVLPIILYIVFAQDQCRRLKLQCWNQEISSKSINPETSRDPTRFPNTPHCYSQLRNGKSTKTQSPEEIKRHSFCASILKYSVYCMHLSLFPRVWIDFVIQYSYVWFHGRPHVLGAIVSFFEKVDLDVRTGCWHSGVLLVVAPSLMRCPDLMGKSRKICVFLRCAYCYHWIHLVPVLFFFVRHCWALERQVNRSICLPPAIVGQDPILYSVPG